MEQERTPRSVKAFFIFLALCAVVAFGLGIFLVYYYFLDQKNPKTAFEFSVAKRTFVEKYVLDKGTGGFQYWVEQDGTVRDSKKYSLFQANIILWLGGMESQRHDQKNIVLIKSAADYLVRYLYKGNGEWYEFDTANHRTRQDFFWNPRSETYIAYALLQAYRITGDRAYLRVAYETNNVQRKKSPTGRILAEYDKNLDIGYKFPETLAHFEEYLLTRNPEALQYAERIQNTYRGTIARERLSDDGSVFYYHGLGTLSQLLYGYLSGSTTAYLEGSIGRESYWSTQHNDEQAFNAAKPGESSDHGRDYYDKRVAMDLVEWSLRHEEDYRADALDMWDQVKGFWDPLPPGGFFINRAETRKTCFTIGMPLMLMDLTAPEVVEVKDTRNGFWNHQTEITVNDPGYYWNDVYLRGIGAQWESVKFRAPWGFTYGAIKRKAGPCTTCATFTVNYISFFGGKGYIETADRFGNKQWQAIQIASGGIFSGVNTFNSTSASFYLVILVMIEVIALTCAIIFYLLDASKKQRGLPD